MIEIRRTVCLDVRGIIDEATVDGIIDGICGDTYAGVNHYGNFCTEIRAEFFDDDYSGKNPAEEVEAELIKAFKEKGYEVMP